MKFDPQDIIYELHSVYTYCEPDTELKNELCKIIYQLAAGLFETVYIRLIGLELEVIKFFGEHLALDNVMINSFYSALNRIETIVDGV